MTISGLTKYAYMAAPVVLGKIIDASSTNKKIGKIALGTGLISSGICMMVSSGLYKLLGSSFKTNQDSLHTKGVKKHDLHFKNQKGKINLSKNPQESKSITNWSAALIGFGATALGIYTIASAFMTDDQIEENNFQHINTCEETLAIGKQAITQCKAANDLWNDVKAEGRFTMQCLQNPANTPSHTIIEDRSIYLGGVDNEDRTLNGSGLFADMIWELSNLKNSGCFNSVLPKICEFTDEFTFAHEVEKCEYKSYSIALDVMKKCAKDANWTTNITFKKLSLAEYLYSQMKIGHTPAYCVEWYRICDPENIKNHIDKLRLIASSEGFNLPYNIDYF